MKNVQKIAVKIVMDHITTVTASLELVVLVVMMAIKERDARLVSECPFFLTGTHHNKALPSHLVMV